MAKPSKKKVLFVIPILNRGGAERVITHIANHIDRDIFKPTILLIFKAEHTYIENVHSDVELVHLNIPTQKKYYFLPTLRGIIRHKPDIVFSGLSGTNVWLSPFIPFFPKIKWIARETNTLSIHVQHKKMLFLYRQFYKNYDAIIAQCMDMKVDLAENFNIPENKINVINNPIDTHFIDGKLMENTAVEFDKNKTNLLACGRLTHQKGFDNLIKAFAKLANREKYHLTILGGEESEEYTTKLLSLVEKLNLKNEVTFAGFQPNSYAWFKHADIFVLSSRYEGFPNVVLEALYCGTPVLANNCKGGITDIITNGKNGYVFNFDKNDFEIQLNKILSLPTESKALSEMAKSRFQLENIIAQYQNLMLKH